MLCAHLAPPLLKARYRTRGLKMANDSPKNQELIPNASHCDLCQSSFACERLSTAALLIETRLKTEPDHEIADLFAQFKSSLNELGWNYPNSKSLCVLESSPPEVTKLTNELIRILVKMDPRKLKRDTQLLRNT